MSWVLVLINLHAGVFSMAIVRTDFPTRASCYRVVEQTTGTGLCITQAQLQAAMQAVSRQ